MTSNDTDSNEGTLQSPDQSSPVTEFYSAGAYEASVIEMVVECWRFERLFRKVTTKLDAGEAAKYISQMRYFNKKVEDILDRFDLKLINLEGQSYEPGMAIVALNLDEFESSDSLIVEQMAEPIIMDKNGLKKMGTVILRRLS